MLMCISCSSKTAVTENEYNSTVDELYGLDEISYTSYADYVDKIGDKSRVSQVDNTSTYDSNTYRARAYNGSNTYDSKTDDMPLPHIVPNYPHWSP